MPLAELSIHSYLTMFLLEDKLLSDDLLVTADPDSKRAEVLFDSFFKRLEDGTWVPGCFAPSVTAESFDFVTNPAELKALVRELLESSCEIPYSEREAFRALL